MRLTVYDKLDFTCVYILHLVWLFKYWQYYYRLAQKRIKTSRLMREPHVNNPREYQVYQLAVLCLFKSKLNHVKIA